MYTRQCDNKNNLGVEKNERFILRANFGIENSAKSTKYKKRKASMQKKYEYPCNFIFLQKNIEPEITIKNVSNLNAADLANIIG